MATINLNKVSKSYTADKVIIDKASLSINHGEFIVIVGPSGCGKSTLLRMIAGLEEISTGEISIDDKIVNDLPPKDRGIAMVFQNYALYPHMNVYDNMAYGLKIKRIPKNEIKQRVDAVAKILELSELLDRKPGQLSGGQRQRVAMGRAIIRKPKVYLFDEPLSNLDAKLRVQMRLEIKKIHREFRTTSVYVTHDQMEAMTLADRLVVINKGKIEQIGTPIQVYRRPTTVFVAGFIGSPSMNFIEAKISNDGKNVVIADKFSLPINYAIPRHYHGNAITLGLRPENINEIDQDHPTHMDLDIDFIEAIGSDTLIYGHIANTDLKLTARFAGKWLKNNPDTKRVSVTVKPNSLHLFNATTKRRIVSEED